MPSFEFENNCLGVVIGVDEAGRGPWAGPVVASAVLILNKNLPADFLGALDDSKKLSAKKRELLYARLLEEERNNNIEIGIGEASVKEIDEVNILEATFLAMKRAAESLKTAPDLALIDGNRHPKGFCCETKTIVGGDGKSISIAAASIVAKVTRDKMMKELALKYPYYAFEKNAGYGTSAHIDGIKKFGICEEHRKSYKPIQAFMK